MPPAHLLGCLVTEDTELMLESIREARRGMNLNSAVRIATGLLAALVLAACAHTPADTSADRSMRGPSEEPVGIPTASRPVPPAEPSAAFPEPLTPPAAQGIESMNAEPTPVVGLTPAQYGDLFDRMRAGFKIDDADRHAIDQQVDWYADHPDYLERAFGRAELYMYHIITELEARGMPLEIALLPVVESAFEPYAYSRARAAGMWQFIPGTGSRFGLKQNWWYDGRRDVVESTRAAFEYLQFLHDEFDGDWLLAIAAYNCGEMNVTRAIRANRAAGKPIDFWSLKLPKETRAYVPKLLAMRRLVADPEAYGLGFSRIPNQPYFTRVETMGQIELKTAAEIAGITHEQLYELNPAFHRWATDPSGPHYLLLPSDVAELFKQNVAQLTSEQRLHATIYTVKKGDSVNAVAKKFGTSIDVVRQMNDLPTGPLTVGTDLRVPAAGVTLPPKVMQAAARVDGKRDRTLRGRQHVHVVRRGDSLWGIARRTGINVNTLAMMNGMQPGDTLRAGQRLKLTGGSAGSSRGAKLASSSSSNASGARPVTYTVRSGDTLSAIARMFQVTAAQIADWNDITTRSSIKPGQKLTIRVTSSRG